MIANVVLFVNERMRANDKNGKITKKIPYWQCGIRLFYGINGRVLYGRILLPAFPAQMLQFEFQSFFVVAEKPQLGLYVILAAGLTNMVLDALLVAVFPLGLPGAAAATAVICWIANKRKYRY